MTREQLQKRNRIVEINTEMRQMLDDAKSVSRAFNPDEQQIFDNLKMERGMLHIDLERSRLDPEQEAVQSANMAFAEAVHNICKRNCAGNEEFAFARGAEISLPHSRAMTVISSTDTAALIPMTIGDIIQPLEKGLILDRVGCRLQYGLIGDWVYPVVASCEASIASENAEINDTKIAIDQLTPAAKRVALSIMVSNSAIDKSNGALLDIVRTQLTKGLTRLLNKWMFQPTNVAANASGCFVSPQTSLNYADKPSYADIVGLRSSVDSTGVVPDETAGYVCNNAMAAILRTTPKDAGSGRFIMEGTAIDGIPVFITEYIGADIIGFGYFSYELIGQFGEMRIIVDPYTKSGSNATRFVLNTEFDMKSARPEAFGKLEKLAGE